MKDAILGSDEDDDETEQHREAPKARPAQASSPRREQDIRFHTAHTARVAVRLNLYTIEDAQVAADGLKNGEHQIVTLDKAKNEMVERIVDFLSGVTYALDGDIQRINGRSWLFVPHTVELKVEEENTRPRTSPFEDERG
jgi:cell division inhibitor SepF